ncbi:unnamed protein product, partial [Larinioides sclopetarius]
RLWILVPWCSTYELHSRLLHCFLKASHSLLLRKVVNIKMAEDLASNLNSYQIQLQQVEAALTNEPDNEELLKLKKDLQEVIQLTTELIAANTEKSSSSVGLGGSSKDSDASGSWSKGERCLAPWSEDGQFYEAIIDEIKEDGQCTVSFTAYGNTDVCDVEQLRPVDNDHAQHPDGSSKSSMYYNIGLQQEGSREKEHLRLSGQHQRPGGHRDVRHRRPAHDGVPAAGEMAARARWGDTRQHQGGGGSEGAAPDALGGTGSLWISQQVYWPGLFSTSTHF